MRSQSRDRLTRSVCISVYVSTTVHAVILTLELLVIILLSNKSVYFTCVCTYIYIVSQKCIHIKNDYKRRV